MSKFGCVKLEMSDGGHDNINILMPLKAWSGSLGRGQIIEEN